MGMFGTYEKQIGTLQHVFQAKHSVHFLSHLNYNTSMIKKKTRVHLQDHLEFGHVNVLQGIIKLMQQSNILSPPLDR